jgi:hypothetical protein
MEKTEEIVNDEETGKEITVENNDGEKPEVKMVPLEKAQEMVNKALAKNLPPKEEMEKYKEWKESQKTEAERQEQQRQELESLRQEKLTTQRENIILKKGVPSDDSDYVLFKVAKMDGDFEENLDNFLKINPKFITKGETKMTTGFKQTVTTPKTEREEHLDKKYGDNPYYKK